MVGKKLYFGHEESLSCGGNIDNPICSGIEFWSLVEKSEQMQERLLVWSMHGAIGKWVRNLEYGVEVHLSRVGIIDNSLCNLPCREDRAVARETTNLDNLHDIAKLWKKLESGNEEYSSRVGNIDIMLCSVASNIGPL